MKDSEKIDPKAPSWFIKKPSSHCSRAFFSHFQKCDVSDKYIWKMIESIRIYMMSKLQKSRDKMMKYFQKICPKSC